MDIIQSCSSIQPGDSGTSYFPKVNWQEGLKAPGAGQMQYLEKLMLGRSYFDRIPDQSMIVDNGERYERVIATRAKNLRHVLCV
jgi:hypothetical protein